MTPAPGPDLVREAALIAGVCARPIVSRVTDNETGDARLVPIACGSTREDRCPPCADRAKRLRIQQCREGWHLDTEPEHQPPTDPNPDVEDEGQADDDIAAMAEQYPARRVDVIDTDLAEARTAPASGNVIDLLPATTTPTSSETVA